MCSIRNSPMPSAPKLRAFCASSGVSALVLTPILRNLSTIDMNLMNIGFSEASIVSIFSPYTQPFVPLRLIQSPSLNVTLPKETVFVSKLIFIASHPTMQHLPHPRATRAACEVIPPRVVRIPAAARMPSMSSGDVSSRMRMVFLPAALASMAASDVNTI